MKFEISNTRIITNQCQDCHLGTRQFWGLATVTRCPETGGGLTVQEVVSKTKEQLDYGGIDC